MTQQPIIPPVVDTTVLPPHPDVVALEERVAAAEARAEAAEKAANAVSDKPTRYAAYDTLLGRYVGPVYDRKPTKAALQALIKADDSVTNDVDDLEIREV